MKIKTRAEAIRLFREDILPFIDKKYPPDRKGRVDGPARREGWSNWVDSMAQDGQVTRWQAENWSNPF